LPTDGDVDTRARVAVSEAGRAEYAEEGKRGASMYILDIFSRLEEKRSLGSGV